MSDQSSSCTSATLAQKLIARAAGRSHVSVGEVLTCQVDLAMFHDSSGPRRLKPMLEELGAEIWDKSRVVLVMDHYVPEQDEDSRRIVRIARDWALDQKLPHVYDSQGICHVVLPQKGHLRPGMFCVGGDSHSPTGGAFGTYMFGIGSTEMLGVVVTGEIWVRVPQTMRMWWDGQLPPGGLVNVVSKRPQFTDSSEVILGYGSYDALRLGLDLNRRASENSDFAWRLNVLRSEGEDAIDFVDRERTYVAPSLTWQPSAATSLTFLALAQDSKQVRPGALPAVGT